MLFPTLVSIIHLGCTLLIVARGQLNLLPGRKVTMDYNIVWSTFKNPICSVSIHFFHSALAFNLFILDLGHVSVCRITIPPDDFHNLWIDAAPRPGVKT